jgi:hypothetical protein
LEKIAIGAEVMGEGENAQDYVGALALTYPRLREVIFTPTTDDEPSLLISIRREEGTGYVQCVRVLLKPKTPDEEFWGLGMF